MDQGSLCEQVMRAHFNWCYVSIRRYVCMLRGKCGTGAWRGIGGYLMRPHTVVLVSETCGFSRHPDLQPQVVSEIILVCLASGRGTVQHCRAWSPTVQPHVTSLIFNRSPALMTFKRRYFKCHQQLLQDTVEPSCLSAKLIPKHAHQLPWTKLHLYSGLAVVDLRHFNNTR